VNVDIDDGNVVNVIVVDDDDYDDDDDDYDHGIDVMLYVIIQ